MSAAARERADADVVVHARPEPFELPPLVMLSRELRVMVRPGELHRFASGEIFRADAEIVAFRPDCFDPVDAHLRRAKA